MKKNRPLPPIDFLRERYEIVGDDLVYKKVSRHGDRRIGGIVGSISQTNLGKRYRYTRVTVGTGQYVPYLVHRIAYAVAYGIDPGEYQVDHIDGNTFNNNPNNLRIATGQENTRNRNYTSLSTKTGIRGVYVRPFRNRPYVAQIKINDIAVHIGSFSSIEDAAAAVSAARMSAYGEFSGSDILQARAE